MKQFALAVLISIALLVAGCTVPATDNTSRTQPGTGIPVTASQPPVTITTATSANPAITPANTSINGTDSGNGTIPSSGDLFSIAPLKAGYHEGDVVSVHGTTILAAGDPLLVEVLSSSFGPTVKTDNQFFTGVSGVVHVVQGPSGGPNTWSFSFPTDGFNPDTYIVTVSGLTVKVEDSTTFVLLPRTI
ncbi:MAG TPA: hypothetical protein VMS89_08460 [Methanoregulaceae archaeon]|nr:hypothetical protein [Methanoregulaceae archaeon]